MKKTCLAIFAPVVLMSICLATFTGCGAKFSADKNIAVVAREDGSGTKSAFMEIIGLKEKKDISGVIIQNGTAAVLQEVAGNPQAIAYDSLGYVTKDVKILKVNGVYPTAETVKNGTYAISRPLSIVYREATLEDAVCKAYYDFLVSRTAQDIVAAEGYVNRDATEDYKVIAGLSGTISISGSTSLQPLMEKLAAKFKELQPGVTVTVAGGGSGTGLKNAENGTSQFGMISKEKKPNDDAPSCVATEVARDGIAVIVNLDNPLDDISLDALKRIYDCDAGDTQITVWNQVN